MMANPPSYEVFSRHLSSSPNSLSFSRFSNISNSSNSNISNSPNSNLQNSSKKEKTENSVDEWYSFSDGSVRRVGAPPEKAGYFSPLKPTFLCYVREDYEEELKKPLSASPLVSPQFCSGVIQFFTESNVVQPRKAISPYIYSLNDSNCDLTLEQIIKNNSELVEAISESQNDDFFEHLAIQEPVFTGHNRKLQLEAAQDDQNQHAEGESGENGENISEKTTNQIPEKTSEDSSEQFPRKSPRKKSEKYSDENYQDLFGKVEFFAQFSNDLEFVPISKSAKMNEIVLAGQVVKVWILPKRALKNRKPVFFFLDGEYRGIYDAETVLESLTRALIFETMTKDDIVVSDQLLFGEELFGFSRDDMDLKIGDAPSPYRCSPSSTYSDLQMIVQKNQKRVSRVLFYANDQPLFPTRCPDALSFALVALSGVNIRFLMIDNPATVNSLPMCRELSVDFYGPSHSLERKEHIWLRKSTTVGSAMSQIPQWFSVPVSYFLASSLQGAPIASRPQLLGENSSNSSPYIGVYISQGAPNEKSGKLGKKSHPQPFYSCFQMNLANERFYKNLNFCGLPETAGGISEAGDFGSPLSPDDKLDAERVRVDAMKGPLPTDCVKILGLLSSSNSNNTYQPVIEVKKLGFNGAVAYFETYGFYQIGAKTDLRALLQQVAKAHPEIKTFPSVYVFRFAGDKEVKKFVKQVEEKDMLIDIISQMKATPGKYQHMRPYLAIQAIEKSPVLL